MTESEMESATKGKSAEARVERWIDSVGTVTLPLLAGFSITSVVVVSDDAGNFRWPGLTILVLTFAALVLLGAVQSAYHARLYLSKDDPDYDKARFWVWWTRTLYDSDLLALLAGLGLVVVPVRYVGREAGFRWAAAGLALCACVVEFVWKLRESWWRSWRGTARRAGVRLTGPMRSVITRLRLRLLPSSCGGSYINLLTPRRPRAETTGPSGVRAGQDDAARRSERPLPHNFMAPIMPVIGAVAVGRLPRQPGPPSPWSSRRGWREWSACRGARGPGHARG